MPETYIDEPEPTKAEAALDALDEAVTQVIAGQGIVRRIVLYVATAALAISPVAPLAIIPLYLLMATDRQLA